MRGETPPTPQRTSRVWRTAVRCAASKPGPYGSAYAPRQRNRQRPRPTESPTSRVSARDSSPAPGFPFIRSAHPSTSHHQHRPRFCFRFARGFPPGTAPAPTAPVGPDTPRSTPEPGTGGNDGEIPAELVPASSAERDRRGAARNSVIFSSVMSQRPPALPALKRPSFNHL